MRTLVLAPLLAVALLLAAPARAAIDVQVAGNTATASINLSGVSADLILTFDDAQNLSAQTLGISAQLLGPVELAAVLTRLQNTTLQSLPLQLPLLITVEPPSGSGFALNNTVRVEVHTHLLPYTAGSSFRLFKAPLNGQFVDITDEVAPGSVRTRGTTGGFSQFLVLVDLRASQSVINEKLTRLRSRLADVGGTLQASLAAQVDAVEAAVAAGQYGDAIATLDGFRADVSANAGSALPNAWTPSSRGNNVAGDLQAAAATLRFSIAYLRDFGN